MRLTLLVSLVVGFYSAFMVSDCVTVHTRTYGSDEAYEWKSKGVEGYSITPWRERTTRYSDYITYQTKYR